MKLASEENQTIELRELGRKEAKKLIMNHIKENPGILTSQIVEDLRIVPWQVGEILEELKKENKVKNSVD
jgi:Mn-dependent DtxR family transcriptional regulator